MSRRQDATEVTIVPTPSPRWLTLDCRCPACRRPPRLRILDSEVPYLDRPPDRIVQEITCGWRSPACEHRYPVTAGAYQRAS